MKKKKVQKFRLTSNTTVTHDKAEVAMISLLSHLNLISGIVIQSGHTQCSYILLLIICYFLLFK